MLDKVPLGSGGLGGSPWGLRAGGLQGSVAVVPSQPVLSHGQLSRVLNRSLTRQATAEVTPPSRFLSATGSTPARIRVVLWPGTSLYLKSSEVIYRITEKSGSWPCVKFQARPQARTKTFPGKPHRESGPPHPRPGAQQGILRSEGSCKQGFRPLPL